MIKVSGRESKKKIAKLRDKQKVGEKKQNRKMENNNNKKKKKTFLEVLIGFLGQLDDKLLFLDTSSFSLSHFFPLPKTSGFEKNDGLLLNAM